MFVSDRPHSSTSWLDRRFFFPVVAIVLFFGHAFDLVGTYVYQPKFEHEVNPIYLSLKPYGLTLNWPMVIAGKAIFFVLTVVGLWVFLRRRRRYYPSEASTFREMFSYFLYGRSISWIEMLYRWPYSLTPTLLFVLASMSFAGPYYACLGYG